MTQPKPAAPAETAAYLSDVDPNHPGAGRPIGGLPAWPLTGVLLLYPLWWGLGLGVLVFYLAAIPMGILLVRRWTVGRPILTPPGFLLWLLFLATVVAGLFCLGADPDGTVPGTAGGRLISYGFRLGGYATLTILLLYAGNLERRELSQRRLARLLAWLFLVTVAGGLLGMAAPHFQFTSPVELLLPKHVRSVGFVQSLVHPSAAQIMDLLGGQTPRPGAPWGYTNTWGNNVCLLVGWLLIAGWQTRRNRVLVIAALAVAMVPVVYSLNRGLWIGLGVMVLYVVARLAGRGRYAGLAVVGLAGVGLVVALAVTPLGGVVSARLQDGKSNGVRMYMTQLAVDGMRGSPLIGYGSTRNTTGGRNSITVGHSVDCPRCGNFTIGGDGQLWQLLYAHGLIGTATYLGFFVVALWRFRRDTSAVGIAGSAALLSGFAAMFWYNALVTPLALTFLAYAALWRNHTQGMTRR